MTQTYNLNLIPGSVPVFVHVKQYDTAPREIVFKLYSGDTVYSIPSNTTITVSGTKPDGNGFSYNVTDFSGSVVTVPMQEQMTVLSGEIPCQLTIAQTGGVIGTATFILDVAPAALSDDVPVSETDLAMFQELAVQTQTEAAGVAGATAQIAQNTSDIATNTAAISQLNSNNYKYVTSQSLLSYVKTLATGTYHFRLDNATEAPVSGGSTYTVIKTHGVNDARCEITCIPMDVSANNIYTTFIPVNATSITWTAQPTRSEVTTLNSKTSGSGTATNTYGSCTYSWVLRANIATVRVEYTPNQAISSSSGGLALTDIPTPALDGITSATTDVSSPSTVCGPAELSLAKNCTLYGARASGKTYKTSFTYVVS